jgi:hypothetical protein
MKQLFTLSFFSLSIFSATAQIQKGSTMLGGDIGISGSKNSYIGTPQYDNSGHSFSIGINAGKAQKDNVITGVALSYGLTQYNNSYNGFQTSTTNNKGYNAGIWQRRYFPLVKSLYAFVNGGAYLIASTGKTKNYNNQQALSNTQENNNYGAMLALYPGVSFQAGKRWFLDAAITNLVYASYSWGKTVSTNAQGDKTTTKNYNYSLSSSVGSNNTPLQLGMRWIFRS